MTSRRAFLGSLGAMVASAAVDPERALWAPGKKLISIPAPLFSESEWQQALDFYRGNQWNPETFNARLMAGRPVLTLNRIWGIVEYQTAKQHVPRYSGKWKLLVVDTYRKWGDSQQVFNIVASELVESKLSPSRMSEFDWWRDHLWGELAQHRRGTFAATL